METPGWALTIAYWLHMLATVTWIGGLASLGLIVLPSARRLLPPESYANLLAGLQRRFDPLGWFSLVLLAGTGMFQMSANTNYAGFLTIDSRWSLAILLKHLVFLVMTVISAYLTWFLLPAARRLALLRGRLDGDQTGAGARLERREVLLLQLNLVLAIIVLALTAAARTA